MLLCPSHLSASYSRTEKLTTMKNWALPASLQIILLPTNSTTSLRELGGLTANLASKETEEKGLFHVHYSLLCCPD